MNFSPPPLTPRTFCSGPTSFFKNISIYVYIYLYIYIMALLLCIREVHPLQIFWNRTAGRILFKKKKTIKINKKNKTNIFLKLFFYKIFIWWWFLSLNRDDLGKSRLFFFLLFFFWFMCLIFTPNTIPQTLSSLFSTQCLSASVLFTYIYMSISTYILWDCMRIILSVLVRMWS